MIRGIKFPIEIKLIHDLDRLWSFTFLNFWQDTIRKDVNPKTYLKNLEKDLKDYFLFNASKKLAKSLLKERKKEVEALSKLPI
jgi:hypothetical protein